MKKRGFLLCCTIVWFLACSFNKPALKQPQQKRLYSLNSKGIIQEQLGLFVLFNDFDGIRDYKDLTLTEEKTGLTWYVSREHTVFLKDPYTGSNEQWIGSNRFIYPRQYFPQGKYTVTVSDLSGNKDSIIFTLNKPSVVQAIPFSFSIDTAQWKIMVSNSSICRRFFLLLLGADKQPLITKQISVHNAKAIGLTTMLRELSPDGRYVQCLAENMDGSIGFLSAIQQLPQAKNNTKVEP